MSEEIQIEKITINNINQILRSRNFLSMLYWDVLSEIKNTPTFKLMKEAIKKIIFDKSDELETLSDNKSKQKDLIKVISSVANTIDTIYSKILYKMLEKEFLRQITIIIKELRNEGEIPDSIWSELEIDDTISVENSKEANSTAISKTVLPETILSPVANIPKKNLPGKSKNEEVDVNDNSDSDTDSVKSIGHVSLTSVSSVHTSDLSSFDDEISISSGDECTKKKISIKEIVSKRTSEKLNGMEKKSSETSQASDKTTDKEVESHTNVLFTPSKRIRKPNSKYLSETILCHSIKVKDKKTSNICTKGANETSNEASSSLKRKMISDTDTHTKIQKTDNVKENNSFAKKTSPKQSDSSQSYKPVVPVRSLTSRRTAPITLYSTTP